MTEQIEHMPYSKAGEQLLDQSVMDNPNGWKNKKPLTAYNQLEPFEQNAVNCYIEQQDWVKMARELFPTLSTHAASRAAMKFSKRPIVQAAIAERFQKFESRYYVTGEKIIDELSKIAFSSLNDYYRIGKNGEPIIDLSNCTPEQMAAMSEISVEDFTEGRGINARDVRRVKFKLHDKLGAIDKLMKHLQMFAPSRLQMVDANGKPFIPVITPEMSIADAGAAYALTLENVNYEENND